MSLVEELTVLRKVYGNEASFAGLLDAVAWMQELNPISRMPCTAPAMATCSTDMLQLFVKDQQHASWISPG